MTVTQVADGIPVTVVASGGVPIDIIADGAIGVTVSADGRGVPVTIVSGAFV